ncbi:hypothetical protein JR338_04725 [Chloroflexota bacterium]|nr:hypothetical protein JR338_04725 [Chloroflexota bacterium]
MPVKELLKPIKIYRLIGLLMTYVMGAALANYVEGMRSWLVFWTGAAFLSCALFGFYYMQALQRVNDEKLKPQGMSLAELKQIRLGLALIAATMLTVAFTIIVGWMFEGLLWQGLIILLVVIFMVGTVLILKGTSEKLQPFLPLLESILVVIIPPALGFFLQTQQMYRFLTMVVMGFVPFYLAFILLRQLIRFGEDQRKDIPTAVTAMGWEAAMVLHNTLILFGYLLLALAALLGLPWNTVWPAFLTAPLGLLEIWLMERVRRGQKPLWRIMQVAMGAVFLLPAYLLTLAFWIH